MILTMKRGTPGKIRRARFGLRIVPLVPLIDSEETGSQAGAHTPALLRIDPKLLSTPPLPMIKIANECPAVDGYDASSCPFGGNRTENFGLD